MNSFYKLFSKRLLSLLVLCLFCVNSFGQKGTLLAQYQGLNNYSEEDLFILSFTACVGGELDEQTESGLRQAFRENQEGALQFLDETEISNLNSSIAEDKSKKSLNLINGITKMATSFIGLGALASLSEKAADKKAQAQYEADLAASRAKTQEQAARLAQASTTTITSNYAQNHGVGNSESTRMRELAASTSNAAMAQSYLMEAQRLETSGVSPITAPQVGGTGEMTIQGATSINGVMSAVQLKVISQNGQPTVTQIKLNNPTPQLNGLRDWYPVNNAFVVATSFQYDGELANDYNYKFNYSLGNTYAVIYFNL